MPPIHPALDLPPTLRIAWLRILAAMAGVDGPPAPEAIRRIEALAAQLAHTADLDYILAAARSPEVSEVRATCSQLAASPQRFALLRDLVAIARIDRALSPAEHELLETLARQLQVSWRELEALTTYAAQVEADAPPLEANELYRDLIAHLAAAITATAAPLVTLIVAGRGVYPRQLAEGLALLGGDFGARGGTAVVGALAIGSFFAARSVFRRLTHAPVPATR